MLSILSAQESRNLDIDTIKEGISSKSDLVNNAGKVVAYHIIEKIKDPFNKSFLCIAGAGDNGIDAIICNSYLNKNSIDSTLMIIDPDKIDKSYLEDSLFVTPSNRLELSKYDYIVDGVFGTGLNRKVKGLYLSILKKMTKHKKIISIDIPSGIYADSGSSSGVCLNSIETITFTYPKYAHYLSDGYKSTGNLFIYNIGHSEDKINNQVFLLKDQDISTLLKPIDLQSDKYKKGKILSLCGSSKYTGAAMLSALAAIKSGTGLLKQAYPYSLKDIFSQLKESVDYPLNDEKLGFLREENFKDIEKLYDWSDCLMVGPGLSTKKESLNLIKKILLSYKNKCVIDATALQVINYKHDKFSKIPKESILTPHYNELSKILKISKDELMNNTISILSEISKHLGERILVLKGSNVIIVDGNNNKYIVDKGTSVLSTAGTGDILTGIISSYVSSGYKIFDAAIIGVYIHAYISSIYSKNHIQNIIASDLISQIPKAQSFFRDRKND